MGGVIIMRIAASLIVFLMACSSSAGEKVEHVCGNGPHTVKVRVKDKEVCTRPNPVLQPDDTYIQQDEVCVDEPQWETVEFSDWPECPDAKRVCSNCLVTSSSGYLILE